MVRLETMLREVVQVLSREAEQDHFPVSWAENVRKDRYDVGHLRATTSGLHALLYATQLFVVLCRVHGCNTVVGLLGSFIGQLLACLTLSTLLQVNPTTAYSGIVLFLPASAADPKLGPV